MKERRELFRAYPSISGSYGGSQSWFADKAMQRGGCGVVAAGDLLLYLGMHRNGCRTEETHGIFQGDGTISKTRYEQYLKGLRKRYFPLLPRFGMPYWVLVVGLNRYFLKNRISLQARWGVLPWNIRKRMDEMLSKDLPVILAVGPNFPLFFRKKKLRFYTEREDATLVCAARTSAHYVVVTATEDDRVQISSWGRKYVIDWEEYKAFTRLNSNYLMGNICYIKERK